MNTLYLSIITGIGIATCALVVIFLFFAPSQTISPSKVTGYHTTYCFTTMMVIYADPTKNSQTVIVNALRDNLSNDDFRDWHGTLPWWRSVVFNTIDKHAVDVTIPSTIINTVNMSKIIISKIDGVGKILPSRAECISY